jgi:tetratricopeptide (TPR) repeat protein
MRIHAKRNSLPIMLLSLGAIVAQAQTPGAGSPPTSPAPAPGLTPTQRGLEPQNPASASSAATAPVDNSTATTFDYLFNHKAEEGTAAKAGADVAGALADKIKAVDVLKTPGLDDPIIRARFETYLSLQAVPDERIKDYFSKMQQVSDTLREGDTFGAWKILYAMGDYTDIDAGISRELANRVEAIWNTDRTANGLEQANTKLRDNIETYDHNADMIADDIKHQEIEDQQKAGSGQSGGGSSSGNGSSGSGAANSALANVNADPTSAEAAMMPTMGGSLQGKMQLTAEYLNLLEARAKIKLNEIRENKMDDEGKTDFARYIKTLFVTHRYYHVIIGADFYRALFNEGEYPVDMADEVNVSLETNNQVTQTIEVFKYKAQKGDIAAAAEQLQEAFIANEFHPGLQGLARDDKEKVGDFLAKLDVLKNQLESRDFEQVEGQISDIKKIANDFDATKPLALVNGIKLESRLRLGKAKLLAEAGQLTQAMQEFQTAAEEWPGNPDLQTSATGFFNNEDVQNQSTTEFDRLVQEQNYRAIFDKQLAFAPAVKGDAAREQQLKDALMKVQKAEMASEKANLLVMNGDVDGAWETIEGAVKDWPDDMKLNKMLADLSGRSADFVSAINHAREAEAKKEMGYSLTWYVNAQSFYPASQIANDGIERVSKQILSTPAGSATMD